MVRPAVSTSASVMSSMAKPATIGCWEDAVATVHSPTPLLRAAEPARAAAPLLPREPATTRR